MENIAFKLPEEVNHSNFPDVILNIGKQIQEIQNQINNLSPAAPPTPSKVNVNGLQDYIEEKTGKRPAKATIYGLVYNRKIPFNKGEKLLIFEVEKIDNWLENGRSMKGY